MSASKISYILANLPNESGVYCMFDQNGKVLYVGKAINLKKRILSYYNKLDHGIKTQSLLAKVTDIKFNITRTETEALLLESNLIKSLHPKYNISLRDDKTYPYIYINNTHKFPRISLYRSKNKPQNHDFYGPYTSTNSVKETINILRKLFKLRNCSDNYFANRTRPCLQYQIKRCTAPCVGYIHEKEYQQAVRNTIDFLQGKSQQIIIRLTDQMHSAVNDLAFERAAILRDQIITLRLMQESQGIVYVHGDADIIIIAIQRDFACVQLVSVRNGEILINQQFFPKIPELLLNVEELSYEYLYQKILEIFIAFYYIDAPYKIPDLIILDQKLPQINLIIELLTYSRSTINIIKPCHIQINPKQAIKKQWLNFARDNLNLALANYNDSTILMAQRYKALCEILHIKTPIIRMECFDVSHTNGNQTVASCVVFDENGPYKQAYRRFNINNITAGDDYAALKQALMRRLQNHPQDLPDVLIVDGGLGQFNIAKQILQLLSKEYIIVIGIAKGVDRKVGYERLFLNNTDEIILKNDSPALHLLQYIRDEAHRFAITQHRHRRQKSWLKSALDSIDGIGIKRKKALLDRFGNINALAKASLEEIMKVSGISKQLAERILATFMH